MTKVKLPFNLKETNNIIDFLKKIRRKPSFKEVSEHWPEDYFEKNAQFRMSCSTCFEDITSYYQNANEPKHVCKKELK